MKGGKAPVPRTNKARFDKMMRTKFDRHFPGPRRKPGRKGRL